MGATAPSYGDGYDPEGFYINADTNDIIDIVFYSLGSAPQETSSRLYNCKDLKDKKNTNFESI